jgi:Uma2 family endonuclease
MNALATRTRLAISIERYRKMAATGVLTPDDRVELIEGDILTLAPIGTRHADITLLLNEHLVLGVGRAGVVGPGQPIDLGNYSEPEPDLTVLKRRNERYRHAHPTAEDVLLIVEVADTSLALDQGPKRALYAQFDVPEYWVIDIPNERAWVYRQPSRGIFQETHELSAGDVLSPASFPGIQISVAELFA